MSHDPTPHPVVVEGSLIAHPGARFAIVASRFNEFIVEKLVGGALDAFARHGVDLSRVTLVRVPGAWEIPVVCAKLASLGQVDGIVALGCVIRGATPHFEQVANEVGKGVASVALSSGVPVAFGVLTTESIEQAIERAGTKMGNKGWDSALTALEMVSLLRALEAKRAT
jgi:6,7-dimethyl-8-ribityllumazine synthase